MILVIDNYDSFVHTVANYLRELGAVPEVVRNDAALPREKPEAIVISPGPCTPDEAGVSMRLVRESFRAGADFRNLSWPSMYRPGVWRARHPRRAPDARRGEPGAP